MKKTCYLILALIILASVYNILASSPINPKAWKAPAAPQATGVYTPNTLLQGFTSLTLPAGSYGPESIAFDYNGVGVTADSQGQLFKIHSGGPLTPWIKLSGRPLGMQFAPTSEQPSKQSLLIADAIAGLIRINPAAEVEVLSNSFAGQPYGFIDDVAIAQNGKIYFSDATRRPWLSEDPNLAMHASQYEILEHGGNGRLFVYDPSSQKVELLLDNLEFSNGVVLSADEDFVLVNETGSYQVRRYWLKGEKAGSNDIFSSNLPGFPDNITAAADGGFWLALIKPRNKMVDLLSDYPKLRKMASRLPQVLLPVGKSFSHVIKLNSTGQVVQSLQDAEAQMENITSAIEQQGLLYLGSLTDSKVAVIDLSALPEIK